MLYFFNKSIIILPMKKIVKVVLFLMIFAILWLNASWILQRNASQERYSGFFKEEQDFDVLLFGSSHILNSIYTNELWNNFGITSYNLANHAEIVKMTYYNIKLALKYKTPKIIVLDAYATDLFDKEIYKPYIHNMLDEYPLSIDKIVAINELFGSADINTTVEYALPLSKYHTRWEQLSSDDFKVKKSVEKGSEARYGLYTNFERNIIHPNNTDNYNLDYIKKIKELCDKKGIKLVLTYIPNYAFTKNTFSSIFFETFAKENNIDYLDFQSANIINPDIDFYDNGKHLNPSGARKATDFLGEYLKQHYSLIDHKNDQKYDKWNIDYSLYIDFKQQKIIENKKKPDVVLASLYNENDFDYLIVINDHFRTDATDTYNKLLNNLNAKKIIINNDNTNAENSNLYVKVINKYTDKIILEEHYDVI